MQVKLTENATQSLNQIAKQLGITTEDAIKVAFELAGMYAAAYADGKDMVIMNKDGWGGVQVRHIITAAEKGAKKK